jgi:hypothetical protein
MLPYKEEISYIIGNIVYKPVSYRFLCLALIIVSDSDKIPDYEISTTKPSSPGIKAKKL